jgi:hypothetical protein
MRCLVCSPSRVPAAVVEVVVVLVALSTRTVLLEEVAAPALVMAEEEHAMDAYARRQQAAR